DRRHEHEVAPRIVHRATAEREPERLVCEPVSVVKHEAREVLRGATGAAAAADAGATLASHVHRQRERALLDWARGLVEILHLDAVVAVHSTAIGESEPVLAVVLIPEQGDTTVRPP